MAPAGNGASVRLCLLKCSNKWVMRNGLNNLERRHAATTGPDQGCRPAAGTSDCRRSQAVGEARWRARRLGLISDQHFTVDTTLIEAWASPDRNGLVVTKSSAAPSVLLCDLNHIAVRERVMAMSRGGVG